MIFLVFRNLAYLYLHICTKLHRLLLKHFLLETVALEQQSVVFLLSTRQDQTKKRKMVQLYMTENTIVTQKVTSCDYENSKCNT